MAKFEKGNDGVKKRKILIIAIIVVLVLALVGGYFLYKNYNSKQLNKALVTGYGIGYNKSLQDVAQGQTQTGSIIVWQNESIQIMSIQDICNGLIQASR